MTDDDLQRALAEAVRDGTRVRRRQLDTFRELGRDAARRGEDLPEVIERLLTVPSDWRLSLPPQGAQALLRATTEVVTAVIHGYESARQGLALDTENARRELVDDLLLGRAHGVAGLLDRGARFGLALSGPHAVLVVEAEQPFVDNAPGTRLVERAALAASDGTGILVTTREDRLVIVRAATDRAAIQQLADRVIAALPAPDGPVRLARTALVGAWQIGIGRPHSGPSGIRTSYLDALEALDLGRRARRPGPVHDAADLLVHRVLIRDEAAMLDLVQSVLTPLTTARGGAEPSLQTLEAYFAEGGNLAATARRLHLSVRAVAYRLERLADLLGLDPASPDDRFTLQTAVEGARLLNWP